VSLHEVEKVTLEKAANLLREFEQIDRETALEPKFREVQWPARYWDRP
jgi:hypothetical protein